MGGISSTEEWRDAYLEMIPKLRDAGIHNALMVDGCVYTENSDSIAKHGAEVFLADTEENTMFGVQMNYYTCGDKDQIASILSGVTLQGLCVCVDDYLDQEQNSLIALADLKEYCNDNAIGTIAFEQVE